MSELRRIIAARDFSRAVTALALELPDAVFDDFRARVDAYLPTGSVVVSAALLDEIKARRREVAARGLMLRTAYEDGEIRALDFVLDRFEKGATT